MHINKFGTNHSEAIVTEDAKNAEMFLHSIDAAAVYHNASTRLQTALNMAMVRKSVFLLKSYMHAVQWAYLH